MSKPKELHPFGNTGRITVVQLLNCSMADAAEICIRSEGCGEWIYAYRIGKTVQVGKYDYYRDKDGALKPTNNFYVPDKPIEICRHDGHCRMLVIPKDIKKLPKEIRDLEVFLFRESYILCSQHIDHGLLIDCYPKCFVPPLTMLRSDQAKLDERQFTLFDNANNTDETEETDE